MAAAAPLPMQVLLRLFPQPAFRNISLQCLGEVRTRLRPPVHIGNFEGGRCTILYLCQAQLCATQPCSAAARAQHQAAAHVEGRSRPWPGPAPLCLQIAALQVGPEYNSHFASLYTFFTAQLAALMPPGTNIPEAYSRWVNW